LYIVIYLVPVELKLIRVHLRGHPFMMSTWRGSGSGGRLRTGRGDQRHVEVHAEI